MYKIVKKRDLNSSVCLMEIEAPRVARKALPGQFIIFRIDEAGERVPLTIAGYDREKGTVTIIFQKVGATTKRLGTLEEGQSIQDFVGPLGNPSELEGKAGKRIAVIGGGLGIAIAYPQAKALHELKCALQTQLAASGSGYFQVIKRCFCHFFSPCPAGRRRPCCSAAAR